MAGGVVIQLFDANFSQNYIFYFYKKKVKYIIISLEKIMLKICYDIFFKIVKLIIFVSVWLILSFKQHHQNEKKNHILENKNL
jgi:predicted amidohydrolase